MFRYFKFTAVALVLALTTPVLAFQGEAEPTLVVGSVAPDLDIEHWLSRGADDRFPEVTDFEPGKVYIVEFWATWCPPCVASMPHLSQLQEKYADSVQVIGITDEPLDRVEGFLQRNVRGNPSMTYAELTKNYCLTDDPDRSSHYSYTEASGVPGIPAAFLIGKTGKVEWIGHPMEIDEPLELVLADNFDALAYQKVKAEREQLQAAIGGVFELAQQGRVNEALGQLDEIIAGVDKSLQRPLEIIKVEILSSVGRSDLAVKQVDQMLGQASGRELD